MSVHEGIKHECDYCDYKATQKGDLKRHKMSVHIGIKMNVVNATVKHKDLKC